MTAVPSPWCILQDILQSPVCIPIEANDESTKVNSGGSVVLYGSFRGW